MAIYKSFRFPIDFDDAFGQGLVIRDGSDELAVFLDKHATAKKVRDDDTTPE